MTRPFEGEAAASYTDGPPRQVPGYDALLRMATILLAEYVPAQGRILVLGAGGGLEIREMAASHAGWHFDGVDPSQDLLTVASKTTSEYDDRVSLYPGYIDTAPQGPYDGATCILTMHFVPLSQRVETLRSVRQRLRPGAPFVMAHMSFPQDEPQRTQWINRNLMYSGTAPEKMEASAHAIATRLHLLDPKDEEDALELAGFKRAELFYAGFGFRGWVTYAP